MSSCVCCGSSVPEGQSTCSMCYGDPYHGSDGYYLEYLEQQEREQQEREETERLLIELMVEADMNYKLCYIEGAWAYFTTQDLKDQWGDDWNDAPYEHNAEEPYKYSGQADTEPYDILMIAWSGPFLTPASGWGNSNFSVEQINRGDIAWLRPDFDGKGSPIPAGTLLKDFVEKVIGGGGMVYVPYNKKDIV